MNASQRKDLTPCVRRWRALAETVSLVLGVLIVSFGPEWTIPWVVTGLGVVSWVTYKKPVE